MSTEQRAQATFIHGKMSLEEQDVSPSALFYLFQEVSKLAPSAQSSFPVNDPPLKWPDEVQRKDPIVLKKEEKDSHLIQTSNIFCHSQVKRGQEESRDDEVWTSVEPQCESNSPWKVLGLINLHCERLLYPNEGEFNDRSTTKWINSTTSLSPAAPDVTESGVRSESDETGYTLGPSFPPPERQQMAASRTDDVTDKCTGDFEEDTGVQPEAVEKAHTVGDTQFLEENAPTALQPQDGFIRGDDFSVNRRLERNQEVRMARSSTEQVLLETHTNGACCDTPMTLYENDEALTALYKPTVTLDHNANILSTEPPSDSHPPPPSFVTPPLESITPVLSTAESRQSISKQNDKITASGCTLFLPDEHTASVSQQRSSVSLSATSSQKLIWEQQNEELGLPSTCQWKTKKPRKQPHPCRSADSHDSGFQGVTFRMDTRLDDTREQCRLCITSKYSTEVHKRTRKSRLRTRASHKLHKTSSSEDENDSTANVLKSKVCASCCTRKTPMWRDAEDGTPLCNACGIRYKKYRVRCVNCWHIPRKEGNSNAHCLKCGNFVKLTSAQRKHTT